MFMFLNLCFQILEALFLKNICEMKFHKFHILQKNERREKEKQNRKGKFLLSFNFHPFPIFVQFQLFETLVPKVLSWKISWQHFQKTTFLVCSLQNINILTKPQILDRLSGQNLWLFSILYFRSMSSNDVLSSKRYQIEKIECYV